MKRYFGADRFWGLLLLLLIFATNSVEGKDDQPLIKLDTLGCGAGECPDYSVSIFLDGRVQYVGRRFVQVEEARESKISVEQVDALFRKARQCGFFTSPDNSRLSERAMLALSRGERNEETAKYLVSASAFDCRTKYILECREYDPEKNASKAIGIPGNGPITFGMIRLRIRDQTRITGGCAYPHLRAVLDEIVGKANVRRLIYGEDTPMRRR